jgi:hypothetical protein
MGKGVDLVGIYFNMLPIPNFRKSNQYPIYAHRQFEIHCHDREKRHMTLMLLTTRGAATLSQSLSSLSHHEY